MVIPNISQTAVSVLDNATAPNDKVMDELNKSTLEQESKDNDIAIAIAVYTLGSSGYKKFQNERYTKDRNLIINVKNSEKEFKKI